MASFRFSLPAGTSKVQLGDGTVLVGVGRTVVADSMYSAELVRAGCTRLDPVATSKPTIGPTVALLGDSIMRRYSTQSDRTDATGFAGWLNAYLKQRVRVIYNGGVSGDTTAQMLARLPAILDQKPDQIWFMGGTNDALSNFPAATTIANLQAIFDTIMASGILLLDFTTMPNSNLSGSVGKDNLYRVNAWRRAYASGKSGQMLSVDAWQALVNPQTGAPAANMLSDGTHPTEAGAQAIARAGFDVLDKVLPAVQRESSGLVDPHNFIFNGGMYGTTGAVGTGVTGTGAIADTWTLQRTGTAAAVGSKVARADWRPSSFQRAAVTGGSAHDRVQWYNYISPTPWASGSGVAYGRRVKTAYADYVNINSAGGSLAVGADPTASWTRNIGDVTTDGTVQLMCVQAYNPGDLCFAEVEYSSSGMSGGWYPRFTIQPQDVAFGTLGTIYANYVDAAEVFGSYNNHSGIIRSPDFILPANTYRFYTLVEAFLGAGVTGNIDVTNVRIARVSDFYP